MGSKDLSSSHHADASTARGRFFEFLGQGRFFLVWSTIKPKTKRAMTTEKKSDNRASEWRGAARARAIIRFFISREYAGQVKMQFPFLWDNSWNKTNHVHFQYDKCLEYYGLLYSIREKYFSWSHVSKSHIQIWSSLIANNKQDTPSIKKE